jgi:L-ascorbate metabolism protein UlaG (beta-lactamase superfamily)
VVITFYGEGCFKLQSGDFVVLSDPFDNKTGLTPPRFKADIILKTLTPLPITSEQNQSAGHLISGPGEYNIKDAAITGFPLAKESSEKFFKTVYLAEFEGFKICFLGHISEIPEPTILEYLEGIDILFAPAGGKPFIDQKSAAKIVKNIRPKIIIPSFFKIPSLKRPADNINVFIEEFNGSKKEKIEPQEKFTVKKKDLAAVKKTEIMILKP